MGGTTAKHERQLTKLQLESVERLNETLIQNDFLLLAQQPDISSSVSPSTGSSTSSSTLESTDDYSSASVSTTSNHGSGSGDGGDETSGGLREEGRKQHRGITKKATKKKRKVILPSDWKEYCELRLVWNACINKKPLMIVQCKCRKDVVDVVLFAKEHNLDVTVRGGFLLNSAHHHLRVNINIDICLFNKRGSQCEWIRSRRRCDAH